MANSFSAHDSGRYLDDYETLTPGVRREQHVSTRPDPRCRVILYGVTEREFRVRVILRANARSSNAAEQIDYVKI